MHGKLQIPNFKLHAVHWQITASEDPVYCVFWVPN